MNKATLIGRLGQDPEIRVTQDNTTVANISLATDESYKDKSGNKVDAVEWHKVVIWGKLADVVQQYVKKGDQIAIEGKLQTRKWTDKDGHDRYTTEVRAISMEMLGSKSDRTESSKPTTEQPKNVPDDTDSDLPF